MIPRSCKTTLQMLGRITLEAVKGRVFFSGTWRWWTQTKHNQTGCMPEEMMAWYINSIQTWVPQRALILLRPGSAALLTIKWIGGFTVMGVWCRGKRWHAGWRIIEDHKDTWRLGPNPKMPGTFLRSWRYKAQQSTVYACVLRTFFPIQQNLSHQLSHTTQ